MNFIALFNDGSCAIASAADEAEARQLIKSDESVFDPKCDKIISIRRLLGEVVTRWSFQRQNEAPNEIPELCGSLSDMLFLEIMDREYPTIVETIGALFFDLARSHIGDPVSDEMTDGESRWIGNAARSK